MKAVVLAAGVGTRLLPLTATRPKLLIPVGGRPILTHLLTSLRQAGIVDVVIVVGYMGEKIRETYGDGQTQGVNIEYVEQRKLNGTGSALKAAEKLVQREEFLTVNGDLYVTASVFEKVKNTHSKHGGNIMSVVKMRNLADFGTVTVGKQGFAASVIEKPRTQQGMHSLANAGIYIFTHDIFSALRQVKPSPRGEIELTDAITRMIRVGEQIKTVELTPEEWLDIGRLWDLLQANERALDSLEPIEEGTVEPRVSLKGKVTVSAGAIIKHGSCVEGPVFVGEGSVVGPNSYLRPYTSLGRHVRVGNASEIKSSIILDDARVPHLSYVGDSVVGQGCNLGAGTLVGNIRFDEQNIKTLVKNKVVDTGRKKLGVILGDQVKTGINVSFSPGVKAGPNCFIGANIIVYRDIPANTKVLLSQKLRFEALKG